MKRSSEFPAPVSDVVPKRPKIASGSQAFPPAQNFSRFVNRILTRGAGANDEGPWQRTLVSFGDMNRSTIGTESNPVLTLSRMVRPNSENLGTMSEAMMLMIIKKDSPRNPSISGPNVRFTELNIHLWNYFIAQIQKRPTDPNDLMDADTFWSGFAVDGVCLNETNDSADWRIKNWEGIPNNMEKEVTVVFSGKVECKNIWGPMLRPGTRLFLILKKKLITGHYVVDAYGQERRFLSVGPPASSEPLTNMPFQLEPWAKQGYDYPPDEALMYKDEFGVRHYGKPIYIGRVWYDKRQTPMRSHYAKGDTDLNDYSKVVTKSEMNIWFNPDY